MNSVPTVAIWLKCPQRLQLRHRRFQQANGTQCLRTAYQRALHATLDLLENSCNSLWGKAQSEAVSLLTRKPPQNQKWSGQLAEASFPDPGFILWPLILPENAKNCILECPQHIFSFSWPDQWRIHRNPE